MINWWIGTAVQLHNVLYGFQAVQVTGTASLKGNLFQQLTVMREEVL